MRAETAKGNPGKRKSGEEVFDQLIALNRKAFEQGRFSTAYHALAGAMNWANEENNEKQLALVEGLAREELVWIDIHSPKYEHSTQSAQLRGHASIYANLERQAHSAQLRIGSRRKFNQMLGAWSIASESD